MAKIDNPLITVEKGIITDIGTASTSHAPALDLGEIILAPPLVNAHAHTQLSWLKSRTVWGKGFTPWLKSMVPQILPVIAGLLPEKRRERENSLYRAWQELAQCHTGLVGDITGTIPGLLPLANKAAAKAGVAVRNFCEWFGFGDMGPLPWPERCRAEMAPPLRASSSPCGHALYSTSPQILRDLKSWCNAHGHVFTFHLAESDEETESLAEGRGELVEFYREKVLPPHWAPPYMRPAQFARELGLLDKNTMVVHGVKLNSAEIEMLGECGAALCLCPYSNRNLQVGAAPVKKLLNSQALLCLGTDGLTSNSSLDVLREALFLRDNLDLPLEALLRMLTINGMAALGESPARASLDMGRRANFSILPDS